MRSLVTLCLVGIVACGSPQPDAPEQDLTSTTVTPGSDRAPVEAFVPPTPAGCAGAGAYDVCFAFEAATPLAVHVKLPDGARPKAIAVVHFHRVPPDVRTKQTLNQVKFPIGNAAELNLYFQVYPGEYRIVVGVDADGDGNPEGPGDDLGWSSASADVPVVDESGAAIVDVGTTPIATTFSLASRK